MGLRGENIGTAYVRILADGTGLDRSIRDEFKKSEPEMRQSGERASEKYNEGFERGMVRATKKNRKAMLDSLALGRGEMDARAKTISSNFAKELRNELRRAVKGTGTGGKGDTTLADTIWNNLIGDFRRTGNKKIFSRALEDLPALIERATKDIQAVETKYNADREAAYKEHAARQARLMADIHTEALHQNDLFNRKQLKLQEDRDRDFEAEQQKFADLMEAHRENDRRNQKRYFDMLAAYRENDRRNQKQWSDMLSDAYTENTKRHKALGAQLNETLAKYERMAKGTEEIDRSFRTRRGRQDLLLDLRALSDRAELFGIRTASLNDRIGDNDRAIRRLHPRLNRFNTVMDKSSDTVGKMFGKGSRNNFFNAIGSMMGGLVSLTKVVPNIIGGFSNLKDIIGTAFREGGGGFSGFLNVLKGGLPAIAGLAALLAGAALVVGPLIASLSMLAGVIVSLASSIGFALAGGLGALAGSVVPIAAAVGGLALAFSDLNAEQKKSLKPTKDAFQSWQDAANKGLFDKIGDGMKRLGPIMESLTPTIRKVGTQLGKQFDLAFDALEGPGGRQFQQALDNFLPDATKRLGDITRQLAGGMGGLFRGMIPITRDFLGWLDKITGKFSVWANSAKGQRSIKQFFEDAKESAKDLWYFVKQIGGLLNDLFFNSKDSGDSMFRSMGDSVKEFRDNVSAADIKKWADDSRKFAEALGDAAVGIGKIAAAFDDSDTRTVATAYFKALALQFEIISAAIVGVMDLVQAMVNAFKVAGGGIAGFFDAIKHGGNPLEGFKRGAAEAMAEIEGTFTRGQVKMRELATESTRVATALARLPGNLQFEVQLLGADATLTDIKRIATQYNLTPKQLRTVVEASGVEVSKKQMQNLIAQMTDVDKKKAKPQVDLNTGPFRKGYRDSINNLLNLGKQKPRPTPQLNGAPLRGDVSGLISGPLKNLANQKPRPTADLNAGPARQGIGSIRGELVKLGIMSVFPTVGLIDHASGVISSIGRGLSGLASKAAGIVIPGHAAGTITSGPELAWIGEAGREAVVPLNRPLSQVDPSVRWLSAIAQGKGVPKMASGGVAGGGKTINVGGLTVVTPNSDARAVASEVVNRLVATGY